jgi:SpoIID/LytB domain protein
MSARRLLLVAAAIAVAVALPALPISAGPSRLRITAPPGESLLVHGEYPPVESSCADPDQPVLHARYRGTIEVVRRTDGSLSLIGEVGFEDYVRGIAEVPRDWPMEALKAQAVAARTYALNRLQNADPGGDYDLCATTSCQVYVGMRVEAGPWGERWIRSVDRTAGQVLLYRGEPAITYYSSTSPGRTLDVEDVFGGEALPYLRGQRETDDQASPLSQWRVDVPFDDLSRFLTADGLWPGGPIRRVSADRGRIRVAGNRAVTLSKDSLRDALNEWAECLSPDRYPGFEPDGYQLPQTVPSIWYRAEQEGAALVLTGRGWGHGIGMVQWGAFGKAKRGLGYGDILGAYYGGLRPQPVQLPGTIRILIAEGLRRITVVPPADVQSDPPVRPTPPWSVTGGERLRTRHGSPPSPVLGVDSVRIPRLLTSGAPLGLRLRASDDVDVQVALEGPATATVGPLPFDEGRVRITAPVPELVPGRYRLRASVTNGVDTIVAGQGSVRVSAAETPTPPANQPTASVAAPEPVPDGGGVSRVVLVAGGALALAVIAMVVLTARRRKGLHRG